MTGNRNHRKSLKVRRIAVDTYRENVAYMHRDCAVYRAEGFQALSKIEVSHAETRILAVLNVVDDISIVSADELGLSEQAFDKLGIRGGDPVTVAQAELPESMDAVRRKIAGDRLDLRDYREIARDISDARYSKMEIAAFLVASSQTALDRDEVLYLTEAMVECGERLAWDRSPVVDKHCIGGIPGNRTSMIVVPIVAAHGMLIAKTSSRAITSPSGTADTMEVLSRVDLQPDELYRVVRAECGCLAWGGTARLAPVDDILISVQRPLAIDSQGQMVASILAKKLAAGSSHLLVDIPVGPTAKVRLMSQAQSLRRLFEFVGGRLGVHVEVVITDGSQPVGRGVGPVLEARDVMQVLRNDPQAPLDLKEKAIALAGRILEFDADVRGGSGSLLARDILESGRALAKMQAIIAAQGRQALDYRPGRLSHEVAANRDGVVVSVDNLRVARIASRAGAPQAKGAGIDLGAKLGSRVARGDLLYRIYSEFESDMAFAVELAGMDCGYVIGDRTPGNAPGWSG